MIHCRHCGAANEAPLDVVGKLCDNCGADIYTPEVEHAASDTLKATADRRGDVLRVVCPHCRFVNEFPGLGMVYVFVCHECGESVEVEEPVQ